MSYKLVFNPFLQGNFQYVSTGGSGSGSNTAIEEVTVVQVGDNVTINLTQLAHAYTAISGVFKNGELLRPTNATFGWSQVGDIVTVLNGFDSDQFQIEYTYA